MFIRQAIETKYLRSTSTLLARIKATCAQGSVTVAYDQSLSPEEAHIAAATALVAKFVKEDAWRYGTHVNPWSRPRVVGQLASGHYVHVFAN